MKGDRERCLEAGMDGYIAKPINRRELIELVEGVAPQRMERPAPAPARRTWSPQALVDRVEGDETLARQLARLFLGEYQLMMIAIREAVALGSAEGLRRAAHTFKGSIGNFIDGPP